MAKRAPKVQRKPKGKPVPCLLIQWSETHTRDGKPACPGCGQPAEMILTFIGEPGWAHKKLPASPSKEAQ